MSNFNPPLGDRTAAPSLSGPPPALRGGAAAGAGVGGWLLALCLTFTVIGPLVCATGANLARRAGTCASTILSNCASEMLVNAPVGIAAPIGSGVVAPPAPTTTAPGMVF